MKENGTVKWFNEKKGYGFIERQAGGDAFVHYSDIDEQKGFKNLREGQEVMFHVVDSPKGTKAVNVVAV